MSGFWSGADVCKCLGFLDARQAQQWVCPRRRVSEKAQSLTRGMAATGYGDLNWATGPWRPRPGSFEADRVGAGVSFSCRLTGATWPRRLRSSVRPSWAWSWRSRERRRRGAGLLCRSWGRERP